jgi:hypothetical protein
MVLEILHRFLMCLGCASCSERPQISSFPRLGVLFPRVQTVFAGFQFSNHRKNTCEDGRPFLGGLMVWTRVPLSWREFTGSKAK